MADEKRITDTASLQKRLEELKTDRKRLEANLAREAAEICGIIKDPVPYVRSTLSQLAADRDIRKDLFKVGIHLAADYVVDKYVYKGVGDLFSGLVDKLKKKQPEKTTQPDLLSQLLNVFAGRN